MKHVITNAAEITILELIDNTFKTGGGPVSVGACVITAPKGPVGEVTQVTSKNWESKFGSPLSKKSYGMEGLRHLSDAVGDCNYVNVVRCVAADAKFPSLTFAYSKDAGVWVADTAYAAGSTVSIDGDVTLRSLIDQDGADVAPTVGNLGDWEVFTDAMRIESDANAYGTVLTLGDIDMMILKIIDGDPSVNRRITITDVDTDTERFTVNIIDKDSLGDDYVLETYEVGVSADDVDDMGAPAFIETVFENNSDILSVDWNDDLTWADVEGALQAIESTEAETVITAFVGGTNGGEPTVEEKKATWELLRNENIIVNLMFAAGEHDGDVLANCADIADDRHCAFFMDAPGYLKYEAAITWLKDIGIKSRHARCYYAPFSASDSWRGGRTVWGVSGAAVAAKAKGNANYTGSIPGVHYSPAGIKRGYLERTGIKQLFPDDIVNRDDLYDARINPVVFSNDGGAYIDDDLTLHYMANYSRFGWVNDIVDYTEQRFLEAASYAKHEPDGLTYNILYRLTKDIMDDLVTSGALVTPRDSTDGTDPYVLTIEQQEIDLWYVQWDICPTGSARRIAGQPTLIK